MNAADPAVLLSVVIPVYNEAGNLAELHRRTGAVLATHWPGRAELIFVDDGSRDGSAAALDAIRRADAAATVITLCRNFGQHAAVTAGFAAARGAIIVTLDADLQNPPEEIPRLVAALDTGHDLVAGVRVNRRDTRFRRLASRLSNLLISRLVGVRMRDYGCMLRAYRRELIDYLLAYGGKTLYIPAFVTWFSAHPLELPVAHHPRRHGRSKYDLFRLMRQLFDLLTMFTLLPIQLITIVGGMLLAGGVAAGAGLLLLPGPGNAVAIVVTALALFAGIQLLALGLISEYLVRIHRETSRLPLYLVKAPPRRQGQPAGGAPSAGG